VALAAPAVVTAVVVAVARATCTDLRRRLAAHALLVGASPAAHLTHFFQALGDFSRRFNAHVRSRHPMSWLLGLVAHEH